MRISDWSSDVCSSDLPASVFAGRCWLSASKPEAHADDEAQVARVFGTLFDIRGGLAESPFIIHADIRSEFPEYIIAKATARLRRKTQVTRKVKRRRHRQGSPCR